MKQGRIAHLKPCKTISQHLHDFLSCCCHRLWLHHWLCFGGSPARQISLNPCDDLGAFSNGCNVRFQQAASRQSCMRARSTLYARRGTMLIPSVQIETIDRRGAGHRAGALADLLHHPSIIILILSRLMHGVSPHGTAY